MMRHLSHRTQGQKICLNLGGIENFNDFISGLLQFIISPYSTFPKYFSAVSVFYVLWSSVNLELHDHRSALHGSTRVSVTWFQIPKSIKFMWFETINPFFFLHKQLKWCQTDCKILSQVSWDHGLNFTSLIRGLKVTFLPPLGREQTVIRKWDKSSGIDIYFSISKKNSW